MLPIALLDQNPNNLGAAVVYQVNLRAFSEQGGFNGVTSRLGHIQKLGANVVWLMPIFPVGQVRSVGGLGSPYSVQNFDEVNPEFGTRRDFQNLVKATHQRKMKVILDWVPNHTSWDNPWLKNKDWYQQNDKGEVIIPPGTNWNDVAALNYESRAMRAAMTASMLNWVKKEGIDGFRCDAADRIPLDFWQTTIAKLRKETGKPLFWLAEGSRAENIAAGFDLNYGWPTYGTIKEIYEGKKPATDWKEDKAPTLRFISNHDEAAWDNSTVNIFGGNDAAFGAFAAVALSGGVPLIYNGQEIAWPEKIPFVTRAPLDWSTGQDQLKRYQALMAFRAKSAAAREGSFRAFGDAKVIAFSKFNMPETVLVVINTTSTPISFPIPGEYLGAWTNVFAQIIDFLGQTKSLGPFECVVYQRKGM